MQIDGTYRYMNETSAPIATLHVRTLPGAASLHAVSVPGAKHILDDKESNYHVFLFDRPLQPVSGEAGAVQIGQTVIVEPFLHPGDTLVVDIDQADQMRDFGAGGIDPLVLAQEADAGNTEAMDVILLLRGNFPLQLRSSGPTR